MRRKNIIEVSGEVLFRNTRSVKDSSEDVRRPHSDDIPEHHREDGVVESIENQATMVKQRALMGLYLGCLNLGVAITQTLQTLMKITIPR